jgi:cellulose synthase/poly-beta-1,6-N-acetylglucosamine synthase-like glycosyltransferase
MLPRWIAARRESYDPSPLPPLPPFFDRLWGMSVNIVAALAAGLLVIIYAWALYNLPVLIAGVRRHCRDRRRPRARSRVPEAQLPTFSVIVPAKNEEAVLPRVLNALLQQDYPAEKVEVIVAEDGSTDLTVGICAAYAARSRGRVRVVRSPGSRGKPSALNHALARCRGDIVAVFDADSIPEPDALVHAAAHFQDASVVAVQGRTLAVNSEANMLTKFVSYEEVGFFAGYASGKEALGLFVDLKGSCQFIRRVVLEEVGGWSERHLSEDLELSVRLMQRGYRVKYASDVRSWQEVPERVSQMVGQRVRWFRGSMEVALRYGRLLRRPSLKTVDAEVTLFGPFVLVLSLISYLFGPLALPGLAGSVVWTVSVAGWLVLTATLVAGAVAFWVAARPKRKRDVLWFPFVYAYFSFQVVLATWAFGKILCGAPREWRKTPKTGTVATPDAGVRDQLARLKSVRGPRD